MRRVLSTQIQNRLPSFQLISTIFIIFDWLANIYICNYNKAVSYLQARRQLKNVFDVSENAKAVIDILSQIPSAAWLYLEDKEIPGLNEDAKFFELFAVFGESHHFAVDTVLRGRACRTTVANISARAKDVKLIWPGISVVRFITILNFRLRLMPWTKKTMNKTPKTKTHIALMSVS